MKILSKLAFLLAFILIITLFLRIGENCLFEKWVDDKNYYIVKDISSVSTLESKFDLSTFSSSTGRFYDKLSVDIKLGESIEFITLTDSGDRCNSRLSNYFPSTRAKLILFRRNKEQIIENISTDIDNAIERKNKCISKKLSYPEYDKYIRKNKLGTPENCETIIDNYVIDKIDTKSFLKENELDLFDSWQVISYPIAFFIDVIQ